MPTSPSPENPPAVVRPLDVYDCLGCGQRLRFDRRGMVPQPQLDACRGQCDWMLIEREGQPVDPPHPPHPPDPSHPPAERPRHG